MTTFWVMLSILAVVTTFGVGTAVNMIARRWWVSLVLFALFSVYLVVRVGSHMVLAEWILYAVGFIGVLLSTVAVRALKKSGYALFT